MCRIEERVEYSPDGRPMTSSRARLCEKARDRKPCRDAVVIPYRYNPKRGSTGRDTPSPINPPTPTSSGTYLVQTRRPSDSNSRPSIRNGQRPGEIIIGFGSKKDKTKKYPSISVSTKPFDRSSVGPRESNEAAVESNSETADESDLGVADESDLGVADESDSEGSEISYTLQTGFPEAPLPPDFDFGGPKGTATQETLFDSPYGSHIPFNPSDRDAGHQKYYSKYKNGIPSQSNQANYLVPLSPTEKSEESTSSPAIVRCTQCPAIFTGVYGKGNLGRHVRQKHSSLKRTTYKCEFAGCDKVFTRKDAVLKHARRHHPIMTSSVRPSFDPQDRIEDETLGDGTTRTVHMELEPVLPVRTRGSVHSWLKTTIGSGSTDKNAEWDYSDSASGLSSYAASVASVFSVTSLASSASDISKGSGYSAVQIATATKVLLSIFYEDKTLLSLYKSAIGNEDIGPERLQRNLRRLFRAYAGLLENEATERLEYLSSQLVLVKSAFLALSIVEKLQNGRLGAHSPRSKRNEESSDEEDDSSDTHLVNEDAFEDLAIFREFLVESDAFRTFCDRLEAFILPKSTYLTHEELTSKGETLKATMMKPASTETVSGHGDVLTWQKWRRDAKLSTDGLFHGAYLETTATSLFHLMMDAIFLATDDLLIAAGRLEPPLSPNMVRLRWQCACGDSLHSDVSELRKGGIEELISHMQRTSGAKVVASPHSHQSGNQKYVMPNPTQWIQKAFTSIFGGSAKKSAACLPQHNTPCTSTTTANALPPQRSILHLLACMHRNRLRKDLKQDRIEDITTDRALLCFLRKQYRLHRGRFLHALSLQSVKGISFVKFRLPIGGSVDVRHHDPCCVADTTGPKTCECIPPPPKVEPSPGAEYRCIPGPPATYPPIPPVYLASLFSCPTDVHEKDTWILDQLPKRTCGELKGQIGQPAEGWGIYYDEGLDGDMLAWTILIVFLVASLLFGVLWSKFQYDIQGAFGVSAYMVACCAAVLPVIVTKLGNKG